MLRKSGLALIGSLLITGSAAAQTADGGATPLSSDDKKHIEALYQAQQPEENFFEGQAATQTLTREDIAAYRSEDGWGKAFKQMQADGYYEGYKNFGQVISGSKSKQGGIENEGAKVTTRPLDGFKPDKTHKVQKPHRVTRVNRPNRPHRPNRPKIR